MLYAWLGAAQTSSQTPNTPTGLSVSGGGSVPATKAPSTFDYYTAARRLSSPHFLAPWTAALAYANDGRNFPDKVFCNATLLSAQWALTDAHCVGDSKMTLKPESLVLLHGSELLGKSRSIEIAEIVVHPEFRGEYRYTGNIALLRLADAARVRPPFPRIPEVSFTEIGTSDARVVGWGSFTEKIRIGENLLQIDVTVEDLAFCNSPTVYAGKVTGEMLCARSKYSGIDACQGFGGSGLIAEVEAGPALIGIVSWGEGCGRPNKPTVYFRTDLYQAWIRSVMEDR